MNAAASVADTASAQQRAVREAASRLRRRRRFHDALVRVVSVCAVLAIWEVGARAISPLLFAPPSRIAVAGVAMIASGELWPYLSLSFRVAAIGMLLGTIVGIAAGVLIARVRLLDLSLEPFVIALYSTPMVALIPLVVIWAGFGDSGKIVVIFLFAVFPVLLNTYQGVRGVDPRLLEVARSFRTSERALWGDVILPSALPFIVAGMRLALGRALIGMVIADLYTSVSGIGYLIVRYAQNLQIDRLLVPVVILSLTGVTLVQALRWVETRIAPWQFAGHDE
ncbi:MAG TPA: ABC transporter permease [bacterium]|nr:ABC transporter permease [bacterium]